MSKKTERERERGNERERLCVREREREGGRETALATKLIND